MSQIEPILGVAEHKKGTGGAWSGEKKLAELMVLTNKFGGWVSADLAGIWMWPTSASRVKSAERLIRRAVERGMLQPHQLNLRTNIYLLTVVGARHIDILEDPDLSGSESPWIRKIKNAKKKGIAWAAPMQLKHHARAIRFLGYLKAICPACRVFTDYEISRWNPDTAKRPDGLALIEGEVMWIEVEGSRKTGEAQKKLAETTVRILWGQAPKLQIDYGQVQANRATFVIPQAGMDTRKVALNHKVRIENSLRSFEIPAKKKPIYLVEESLSGPEVRDMFSVGLLDLDPTSPLRIDRVFGIDYPEEDDFP